MAILAFYGTCIDTPKFGETRGSGEVTLIVVSDGRIKSLHRGPAAEEHRKILEKDGLLVRVIDEFEVLVPGFIDTHIHFPQFPFTGAGIDKPLMGHDGFLTKYAFPTEESMVDLDTARAVYGRAVDTLLRHGTTTALIFASIHSEASKALVDLALEKGGPRAFVGKVCVDRHCPDSYIETTEASLILNADVVSILWFRFVGMHSTLCPFESLLSTDLFPRKATEDFIQYTQSQAARSDRWPYLAQPVVTPRFLPTCSVELLRGLGQLAERYQCMIQSHMSESIDEVEFAQSLFGQMDAEVFSTFGLLTGTSVMAHCVQMKQEEETGWWFKDV